MERGQELHQARRRKRMSQPVLAKAAGVSVRTVRRAETGEAISDESMRCLCAVLDLQAEVPDEARPWSGPVRDAIPRDEVEVSFGPRAALMLRAIGAIPLLVAVVAAAHVVAGAWPGAGPFGLAFLVAPLALVFGATGLAARFGETNAALVTGGGFIYVGALWLIHQGAGSPVAVGGVVMLQIASGFAMMLLAMHNRHREWRAEASAD